MKMLPCNGPSTNWYMGCCRLSCVLMASFVIWLFVPHSSRMPSFIIQKLIIRKLLTYVALSLANCCLNSVSTLINSLQLWSVLFGGERWLADAPHGFSHGICPSGRHKFREIELLPVKSATQHKYNINLVKPVSEIKLH